ncbi:MAG: GNAT family N-acetyltransferase [Candidatus Aenigmarchaeota archaeon]|nr:GNAT family N-acetyltransferase [Candidatus Aenigmarchaeota archaeon]
MGEQIQPERLSLVRLARFHDISKFDCVTKDDEDRDLNDFLKDDALKYQDLGFAVTYVCIYEEQMIGYITMCNDSVRLTTGEKKQHFDGIEIPEVPAIKIARLAVHKDFQRRGIGRYLILRALMMARDAKANIGVRVMTVEAKQHSVGYYKDKLGFKLLEHENYEKKEHPYLWIDIFVPEFLEK